MKKIGILTFFYNTINYGGALQAYALSKVLNDKGFHAEQISYKIQSTNQHESILHRIKRKGVLSIAAKLIDMVYCKLNANRIAKLKEQKQEAFKHFTGEMIPHTEKIYTSNIIKETVALYDAFITGSDQVWNGYDYAYYLDFVPESKQKISYAASIARASLSGSQKEVFRKSLSTFDSVSVREAEAVALLKDVTVNEPVLVADPTLLLAKEDWELVCQECAVDGDYVLCYFLGDNRKAKMLAKKFANQNELKTVFIPINYGIASVFDAQYADISRNDVSPQQFIYLIKNAKYIFTDSFHAMVFSFLFRKQFFIFKRNKQNEMSSRIDNVAEYFNASARVCFTNERETIQYINSCPPMDYEEDFSQLEELKKRSFEFLFHAVEGLNQ